MPHKSDEEIRKSIKKYEESLPESERNPNAQEDIKRTIERASRPLPTKREMPLRPDDYSDTQTRSRKAGGTSAKRNDTSRLS
jgi:hypothetical protein